MKMSCFVHKKRHLQANFSGHAWSCWYSNPQLLSFTGGRVTPLLMAHSDVNPIWQLRWTWAYYKDDSLSIKLCKNDYFRKLFLFFEKTFQYLRGIFQDISVSHFDSRRSLSHGSANRRRSTSPIFFVSFTQPCDQQQEDPKDPQERCAMARTLCARLQEIIFACEFAICS